MVELGARYTSYPPAHQADELTIAEAVSWYHIHESWVFATSVVVDPINEALRTRYLSSIQDIVDDTIGEYYVEKAISSIVAEMAVPTF